MARRETARPQAVISSLCEDLSTTVLGFARFLHRCCIPAGVHICSWCLLFRGGAPQYENPWLVSGRGLSSSSSLTLPVHQSCCKKGPCSILTLLAIALATNTDVMFAIAPFHRSHRSLYPWVHLVGSETKANTKQAGWKRGSGLFCSSRAPKYKLSGWVM